MIKCKGPDKNIGPFSFQGKTKTLIKLLVENLPQGKKTELNEYIFLF